MEWPLEEAVPLKAAPGAFPIDSRYVAPLLITLILVIGQFSYGILESYPRTLLAIGCSIVTEIVLSYLVYRKFPQQWILAAVLGSIFRGSSGMCPAADGYGPSSPLWGEGFRTTAFCLEGTSLRGRKLHKQIENYTVLPQQTRLVRLNRRDNHNSRNLFCERRHQTLPESAAGPHGPVRCPAPAWSGSRLAGLPVRGREQGPARRLIREDTRHLCATLYFSVYPLDAVGCSQQAAVRFWKRKHHEARVPVLFYTMAVKGNMPIDLHGGVQQHWKQSGQGFETICGQLLQKGSR